MIKSTQHSLKFTVLEEIALDGGAGTVYAMNNAYWWVNTADKLANIKVYAASANQTSFKGTITLKKLAQ